MNSQLNTFTDIAIYIHWPFCLSKCPYCAFVSIPYQENLQERFLAKTKSDLLQQLGYIGDKSVKSIFFGGGTPSLIPTTELSAIIDLINKSVKIDSEAEITIEANPDTLDLRKIDELRSIGFNRISVGIQSFFDDDLSFLGRRCSAEQNQHISDLIVNRFQNFNFDFIYGLPNQSREHILQNLKIANKFGVPHISYYRLTYEKNTPMHSRLISGKISDITEEDEISQFNLINETLQSYDIFRYEISNFAKQGFECLQNQCYWRYSDYLGVGASAHGRITIDEHKYALENERNPMQWLDKPSKIIPLSDSDLLEEAFIMGLRTTQGVDLNYINHLIKNRKDILKNQEITELIQKGILKLDNNNLSLKPKYLDIADYIIKRIFL